MDGMNLFLVIAIGIGAYTWFAGATAGPVVLVLILTGMLVLYVGGKQYLRESFEDGEGTVSPSTTNLMALSDATGVQRTLATTIDMSSGDEGSGGSGSDITIYKDASTGSTIDKPVETPIVMKDNLLPYATTPILAVSDYDDPSSSNMLLSDLNPDETELDAVAMNEGDRGEEVSRAIKNKRSFDRQFEWSNNLPPNSVVQQTQKAKWSASAATAAAAAATTTGSGQAREGFQNAGDSNYASVDGSKMVPMDMDDVEEEERKILQTFEPVKSTGLTTYDPDDVQMLLDKVYTAKGKRASYIKRDDGVYEVFETEDLEPKIVYEDEEEQPTRESGDGTDTIAVPKGVSKYASAIDPFFEPRQTTRPNRSDYTAWTPGLERMFAPTDPKQQWY